MVAYFLAKLQKIASLPLLLQTAKRGIEREALRVTREGRLAQTPHPQAFGSKLTNPQITTDFSENLIELITPTCQSVDALMHTLTQIHQTVRTALVDEYLWPMSMPCPIESEDEIPIADYGPSPEGQFKMRYRRGLAYRYGKRIQTISGVHYNFSLPLEFWERFQTIAGSPSQPLQTWINERYLQAARNHMQYAWVLAYLFGASPMINADLISQENRAQPDLQALGAHTWIAPYGTSLRSTPLGYYSAVQDAHVPIRFDRFDHYVADLKKASETPYPPYQKISDQYGADAQVNTHLLQIPAEFYHPIRLKRNVRDQNDLLAALQTEGVEYLELRSLDINPYAPEGISRDQILFLDIYLLFCILKADAPSWNPHWKTNLHLTGLRGRHPDFQLIYGEQTQNLNTSLQSLFQSFFEIAAAVDTDQAYPDALERIFATVLDPRTLPSARMLAESR